MKTMTKTLTRPREALPQVSLHLTQGGCLLSDAAGSEGGAVVDARLERKAITCAAQMVRELIDCEGKCLVDALYEMTGEKLLLYLAHAYKQGHLAGGSDMRDRAVEAAMQTAIPALEKKKARGVK